MRVAPAGEIFADIGREIDAVPVDAPDRVAHLQGVLPLIGAAVHEVRERRRGKALRLRKHDQKQQQTEHEVHERAGAENQKPLPCRLARECARVIDRLVLARHGTKPADRQAADGVERLPLLLFPDGGAHADGEFIHAHPARLGHEKMTELMHGDEDTEDENCEQNIHVLSFQKWKYDRTKVRAS